MTDKEVVKCAEECIGDIPPCGVCPFDEDAIATSECMGEVIKNLIGIINRLQDEREALINGQETLQKTIVEQKAEIERLQKENKSIRYCYEQAKQYNDTLAESCEKNCQKFNMTTRAEAIKEFAERAAEAFSFFEQYDTLHIYEIQDRIDNLAIEMTESVNYGSSKTNHI